MTSNVRNFKILALNDAQEGGGAELVFQKTAELLRSSGHEVCVYFGKLKPKLEWKDAFSYLYSFKHARELKKRLFNVKPDIVHLHNFYHYLSPSALHSLKKWKTELGFKVIITVHDYHFLCANNGSVRWKKGEPTICHACDGRQYHKILLNNCDHRGIAFNVLKYLQHIFAYKFAQLDQVFDHFITPSYFLKDKLSSFCPPEKVSVIHNPAFGTQEIFNSKKSSVKDQCISIGRLEPVKGLHRFLENEYDPKVFGAFLILGDGEESYKQRLKEIVKRKNYSSDVTFLGWVPHHQALRLLKESRQLIFTSLCCENGPLTVLEARMLGKNVYHYGLGAIDEMLKLPMDQITEQVYLSKLNKKFNEIVEHS